MEQKIKYQYSYFIYPYLVEEKKYNKYLLKLLKDKKCELKIFENEKDLNLYTYFLPNIREKLFWSFGRTRRQMKSLNELEDGVKANLLAKNECNIFEYSLEYSFTFIAESKFIPILTKPHKVSLNLSNNFLLSLSNSCQS